MIHYILDASIVVQHVISDKHTPNVDVLFDGIGDTITGHVPEFCLLECTNVLWKQVRFQDASQTNAENLAKDLIALDLQITPALSLLPRALELGLKHQLAVYDTVYIALAEKLTYPLITDDKKQAKAASAEGVTLKIITDFVP